MQAEILTGFLCFYGNLEMFFFPKKSWWRDGVYLPKNEEVMVVVFGVLGQRRRRKGVSQSMCEIEAQPKGVIFERSSSVLF